MKWNKIISAILQNGLKKIHALPRESSVPERAKLSTRPYPRLHFCIKGHFDVTIYKNGVQENLCVGAGEALFAPGDQYTVPNLTRDYELFSLGLDPSSFTLLHETCLGGVKEG